MARRSSERINSSEKFAEIREQIEEAESRASVVHLAEILQENEELKAKEEAKAADSAAEQAKDELTPPEAAEEPEKETAQVDPFEEPSPQQIEALNILGDYVALAKR